MNLITIGVPVYRGALTLPETLRCIQNQHLRDIDVVISIDGGDDSSSRIIDGFLDDARVRCVRQPHRLGWAGNLSWLADQCRSRYFCYWQQDDLASHNYLSELWRIHHEQPDTGVAYTDVQWFGEAFHREALPSIDSPDPRARVIDYVDAQHWIPLRGLIRAELLRHRPPFAEVCSTSPFEHGFLAFLAGCAPLRRTERAMYFKRAHHEQWGASFDKRPREQRRSDWVTRAGVLLDALDHVSAPHLRPDSIHRIVERFADPPSGRFTDHCYSGRGAHALFVRDAIAQDPTRWAGRIEGWATIGGEPARSERRAQDLRTRPIRHPQTWSMARDATVTGERYLGFGWSHREAWGTWSEVTRPSLFLPRVERSGRLRIECTHHGLPGGSARIHWSIDGHVDGSDEVACGIPVTLDVPVEPGQRVLTLCLPDAVSSAALGASSDDRQLGLGVGAMSVTC